MEFLIHNFNKVAQIAIDQGWLRTGLFKNLNNDRCIRGRWLKGAGRTERVLYFAVNVDSGEIIDFRCIRNNREITVETVSTTDAINFLMSK